MTTSSHRNLARSLRRRATEAERALWRQLRFRVALEGTYFRRQVPLGPYVVDFACFRHRLVIELDGSQHGAGRDRTSDEARTRDLQHRGFRVLRFWNYQVFDEVEAVLDTIEAALRNGRLTEKVGGEEPRLDEIGGHRTTDPETATNGSGRSLLS